MATSRSSLTVKVLVSPAFTGVWKRYTSGVSSTGLSVSTSLNCWLVRFGCSISSVRSVWLRLTIRYFFSSVTFVTVVTIPFTAFTLVIFCVPGPACGSTSVPRSMA